MYIPILRIHLLYTYSTHLTVSIYLFLFYISNPIYLYSISFFSNLLTRNTVFWIHILITHVLCLRYLLHVTMFCPSMIHLSILCMSPFSVSMFHIFMFYTSLFFLSIPCTMSYMTLLHFHILFISFYSSDIHCPCLHP